MTLLRYLLFTTQVFLTLAVLPVSLLLHFDQPMKMVELVVGYLAIMAILVSLSRAVRRRIEAERGPAGSREPAEAEG